MRESINANVTSVKFLQVQLNDINVLGRQLAGLFGPSEERTIFRFATTIFY